MDKEQNKQLATTETGLVKSDWTYSDNLDDMLNKAQQLVKSKLVPFQKAEDFVIVWQYAKDVGLPFSMAVSELYAIPGSGGTRVSAGVHIHEAIVLKVPGASFEVIEEAVEVRHYKLKGLGIKKLSIDEVMEGIENDKYQVVSYDDFNEDGSLKVEKTGKFLIMEVTVAGFDENFVDRRTTIRFKRPDKEIDTTISYYLHEAGLAGFLGKSNWVQHQVAMLYTRCFTRGSKRFFSDVLKNLGELSEVAQYSNVPYEFDENGHVTVDTSFEEVEPEATGENDAPDVTIDIVSE